MTSFLHIILATFSFISLLSLQPTFSQTTCKSFTFSNTTTTFSKCNDLPTLNAILHWTYNLSQSTLSMAFTAPPTSAQGWVAWAINPKALTMLGSQALIAFQPNNGGPISVNTYDIKSYAAIVKGPISYHVTNLSAEESDGQITIFATWTIPKGVMEVNQVWQVGPIVNGKIGKHEFEKANLNSVMKLSLVDGPSESPATAPVPVAGVDTPKNGAVKSCGMCGIIMGLVSLGVSFLVNSLI